MKKNAVLVFSASELYWEIGRFAPFVIWKKYKQYKNRGDVDFIILTKKDNFDIYGRHASILVPFELKDELNYKPNCFRLDGLSEINYSSIIEQFKNQFKSRYNILETLYPNISKNQFSNKNQFPRDKAIYDYKPRISNLNILENYIPSNKKCVVISPRYRNGLRRNWEYWNDLYDLIYNDKKLMENYFFVICGKKDQYIPDLKNRFLDINQIEQNINTSLIGLTIEALKKSVLCIGSQSAIPNISLLLGTEVLEWGHQKHLHTVTYNVKKTKVNFLEDMKYNIKPEIIYKNIVEILKGK